MTMQYFYCVLFFCTLTYLGYKAYRLNNKVAFIVIVPWIMTSFLGIFYFQNPFEQENLHISLMPYIYIVVCLFIGLYPFKKFNENTIVEKKIVGNIELYKIIIFLLVVCSFEPFVESFIYLVKNSGATMVENKMLIHMGDYDSRFFLSNIGREFYSAEEYFAYFTIPFFFIYLSQKEKKYIYIIGLVCAILVPVLGSLTNGARNIIMQRCLLFLFNYYLFKKRLSDDILVKIRIGGYIFLGCIISLIIAISIARFGKDSDYLDQYDTTYQYLRYFGESTVRFNSDAYYSDYHTGGLKFFYGLLKYFGYETYDTEQLSFRFGFVSNCFYTNIGEVFMDFGVWEGLLFFLVPCILLHKATNKDWKTLNVGDVLLYNLWGSMWIFGIFYNVFANTWIHVLFTFGVAMFFKFMPSGTLVNDIYHSKQQ